jgi:putative transposase
MSEIDRLTENSDWIHLDFIQRERTPEGIVKIGIQLHLAGLSLSDIKQHLEKLGVKHSRTVTHNWLQKADLRPTGTRSSNYVTVDETVIQLGTERYWLYAAVDPMTNEFLHVRLFPTTNSSLTHAFRLNSARNTTSNMRGFPSMTPTISNLHCRGLDFDFISVATEIVRSSKVFFVR